MFINQLHRNLVLASTLLSLPIYADQDTNRTDVSRSTFQEEKEDQLVPLYNESGSYVFRDNWNVFVIADYVYWKWAQDTMQFGTVITETGNVLEGFTGSNTAVFQNPGYSSGFQVGLGINLRGMDDWQLYSEYTWYKNTSRFTFTGTSGNPFVFIESIFLDSKNVAVGRDLVGSLSTQARMEFQSLDFLVQRPFYFGKRLTSNFSVGLRAQWITQKYQSSSSLLTGVRGNLSVSNFSFSSKNTTWGLGPKVAFSSNWLLGYGLKLLANLDQSMLYTSYNTSGALGGQIQTGFPFTGGSSGLRNYGTLRPVTESFLGLGWGSYFSKQLFHYEMVIGYDFNVCWDYNMIYEVTRQKVGNMYLHGINAQIRFDF